MAACEGCGPRTIPLAGGFGPSFVPTGAGRILTASGVALRPGVRADLSPSFDWTRHPVAWLLIIALVVIFARKFMA